MRMVEIIEKKRDGRALDNDELNYFVGEYTRGSIPDYQAAALLMAIYLRGMDEEETSALALAMAHSGDVVDLSGIPGVKVDKHSTGGVGDKTTLVVAPIAASLGVPVAKMSGRGLGNTGGTVDKLESIPGYRTSLDRENFLNIVRSGGISIAGQSGNLAPADKKLYALRDMTGTVESIPLIAASIMSKKIAAGADAIVLDVKTGSGAFMKTLESARALAKTMVRIGEGAGKATVALLTNMNVPLGNTVGNSLEVVEAVETLRGRGPRELTGLCVELAANMLLMAGKGDLAACRKLAQGSISDGSAFAKLLEMTAAQGGDVSFLTQTRKFPRARVVEDVCAPSAGFITAMDCGQVGRASMALGAGRETKDGAVDHSAGIVLLRKTGERVEEGQPVARLHTSGGKKLEAARRIFLSSLTLGGSPPPPQPLIFDRVGKEHL